MASVKQAAPAVRPELVFALVRPTGCASREIVTALTAELSRVGYTVAGSIKVSQLLHGLEDYAHLKVAELKEDERIEKHMNAGDDLRVRLDDGGALAYLVGCEVAKRRPSEAGSVAWIVDSLKHSREVAVLRELYSSQLILVSVYDDEENRVRNLTRAIARSWGTQRDAEARARTLIQRDQDGSDTVPNGQDVRRTFPLADYFLSLGQDLRKQVARMVETLFGRPNRSPSRDEYAMCVARGAALRSADLSRQVGAVIVDEDGEVVVAGCNEVPKAGGGVYWEGDADDARDHTLGYDPNAATSREMLVEFFERLKSLGWLSETNAKRDSAELAEDARKERRLKRTRIASLVEFGRIVHAEMNAVLRAAAGGYRIRGMRMVCTTFPCHVCARHLLGAGISEVVYVEPYPKSLALQQYPGAIVVGEKAPADTLQFRPFSGWAPSRYVRIFEFGERKSSDGYLAEWDPKQQPPKLVGFPDAHKSIERTWIRKTDRMLAANKIRRVKSGKSNNPRRDRDG